MGSKVWPHISNHSLPTRGARWAALALGFTVLAIWSIWPAPRYAYTALPTGQSAPGTVPMLNAWTIWWNADRLTNGLAGYWDAPIFHPEPGTFAFSEPQPATWVVAPIVWATRSPMPAYQAYLVGTLVLNALFAVRLLRTLRIRWSVAATGGVAVLLLPLVHQNREAMQLMSLWGTLWTLEALIQHHRRPSWWRGVVLGIAFSSVFMSCIHHGVFLGILLGLSAWTVIPRRHWKPWLGGLALGGVTAALLLLPLLFPMRKILAEHEFARKAVKVQSLSATPSDWLQTAPGAVTDFVGTKHRVSRPLSPGWIRTGLALAGLVLATRYRRQRRAVVLLAFLGCWAMLWSFGMNLKIGGWQPWLTLTDWLPGFSQVRSVYRFAYFSQLSVILLAAFGLDRFSRCRAVQGRTKRSYWLHCGAFIALCVLVAFEVPPAPVRLAVVPEVSAEHPWIGFLREHTPKGRAIVCLPFAEGYSAKELECTGRWMLYGTRHGVPMVNGYSGFFPKSWFRMVEALKEEPFTESALGQLAEAGVEYVVVDPAFVAASGSPGTASGRCRLERAFGDGSGVEIWRLTSLAPPARAD